jgi:hypothetical protein
MRSDLGKPYLFAPLEILFQIARQHRGETAGGVTASLHRVS